MPPALLNQGIDMFYNTERIGLFIDGYSLYQTVRAMDLRIDYKALRDLFASKGRLNRVQYFATVNDHDPDEFNPQRKTFDWLQYNGFDVQTIQTRSFTGSDGEIQYRGNASVLMTCYALKHAEHLDHVVILTGNADFAPLITALQERGTRVTMVSTIKNGSLCSDQLRRSADDFIDLEDLRQQISKPAST